MSLKASVQYDDLVGTAAADGHESLSNIREFLKSKGVDVDKNEPVGIELYGWEGRIGVRFICKEQGNQLVASELKDSLSLTDLFSFINALKLYSCQNIWTRHLLKRFTILMSNVISKD